MIKDNELQFIIQRIDNFIINTNLKSSIIIGLNTFILGGIIANINIITEATLYKNALLNLIIFSLSGIVISSYYAIKTIYPQLFSSGNTMIPKSGIFFGSIATQEDADYLSYISHNSYSFKEDLKTQILEVASIANDKHKYLQSSLFFLAMYAAFPLFIAILVYLIELLNSSILYNSLIGVLIILIIYVLNLIRKEI